MFRGNRTHTSPGGNNDHDRRADHHGGGNIFVALHHCNNVNKRDLVAVHHPARGAARVEHVRGLV